jgi:hypothetical protein
MIAFRLGTNEQGDTIVDVVEGGRHFGGVFMGRLNCGSGGLDIDHASLLETFISQGVIRHFGGIQNPLV